MITKTLQSASWYALYTLPRWEKKVAERLCQKRIEHYCPLNRVLKQWSDRKKVVEEPLFSSYVFVRLNEAEKWKVKEVKGVLNYVYWQGKPAIIPDKDIDTIKRFLSQHDNVNIRAINLKLNDQVRIISGPFMDMEARVIGTKGKKIQVEIPSLSISLYATIHQNELENISYPQASNF